MYSTSERMTGYGLVLGIPYLHYERSPSSISDRDQELDTLLYFGICVPGHVPIQATICLWAKPDGVPSRTRTVTRLRSFHKDMLVTTTRCTVTFQVQYPGSFRLSQ